MAPRASLSVAPSDCRPAKRPRLSKSTLRVLSIWDQLAERYNKRLDEDDIVDLYSGTIISDRGVLRSAEKDYDIGHFAPNDTQDNQEQDQADSEQEQEQDDDVDELDTLPAQNSSRTDGTMASTSELLRAVPPLSATTDADDLNEFLEAEKRQRKLLGDQDGEDVISTEELATLREALRQSQEGKEPPEIGKEDESEDELGVWQDEASAVYHIAHSESEQDVAEDEPKIDEPIDSDEELAILLQRPPRTEKRKRIPFSLQRGISTGHTPVPTTPTALHTRFGSCISSQDTPVSDTPPAASDTRLKSRISSFQDTSGNTDIPRRLHNRLPMSIAPDTPLATSRTRIPPRISFEYTPVPGTPSTSSTRFASFMSENTPVSDIHLTPSNTDFTFRMSSEDIAVPDTPLASSSRSASRTPRTPVYPFPPHPINLDSAQPSPQILYQTIQHLQYVATMLSYNSPHMPPPPTGPWGTYPPSFAHPWGPRGATVDDDRTLVDDDSTPDVESDGGLLENDRRRRRFTSSIGPGKDVIEKGVHSGRSHLTDHEEKLQGKQTTAKRRASGPLFPEHDFKKSASASKKKGKAKGKS